MCLITGYLIILIILTSLTWLIAVRASLRVNVEIASAAGMLILINHHALTHGLPHVHKVRSERSFDDTFQRVPYRSPIFVAQDVGVQLRRLGVRVACS